MLLRHSGSNKGLNRRGCGRPCSWNCGAEGETGDEGVNALRQRQMRNLHLALMVSQGMPMVLMGALAHLSANTRLQYLRLRCPVKREAQPKVSCMHLRASNTSCEPCYRHLPDVLNLSRLGGLKYPLSTPRALNAVRGKVHAAACCSSWVSSGAKGGNPNPNSWDKSRFDSCSCLYDLLIGIW